MNVTGKLSTLHNPIQTASEFCTVICGQVYCASPTPRSPPTCHPCRKRSPPLNLSPVLLSCLCSQNTRMWLGGAEVRLCVFCSCDSHRGVRPKSGSVPSITHPPYQSTAYLGSRRLITSDFMSTEFIESSEIQGLTMAFYSAPSPVDHPTSAASSDPL